jgi:FecR protein
MKTISATIAILMAFAMVGVGSLAQQAAGTGQEGARVEMAAGESLHGGASQVRIVRLSQVKGDVKLDRGTEKGFEAAFANLPVVQNQRLQTHQGIAEVEFEDNSSLRVTPDSLIEFPVLQRSSTGGTMTGVKLVKGTLYVSLANAKGSEFTVAFGDEKVVVTPSSHIRIDLDDSKAKLAVFNGEVQVTDASGTLTASKKKTLMFDLAARTPAVVAKNDEAGQFDDWDKSEMDYHKLRSSASSAFSGGSNLYGVSDLYYYGSFNNIGGCGSMWRPYMASAAWDPFANGVWAWYPSAGYSWVSPYPWGWAPFHYGSWSYCGGGWGWSPGGQWIGLVNQPMILNAGNSGRYANVPRPPHHPVPGGSTLAVVNTRPLVVSKPVSAESFVFQKDSAGLGVPRGAMGGKLGGVSAGVARQGSVSTPIVTSSSFAQSFSRSGQAGVPEAARSGEMQGRSNAVVSSHSSAASSGWSGGGGHAAPSAPSMSSAPSVSAPAAPAGGGAHH